MKKLAVALALALACAMAEGAGQLVFRLQSGHWLWRDSAFTSNTVVPYTERVGDRREYALRRNYRDPAHHLAIGPDGFRVTAPAAARPDRVVVNLGDSVPFGAGCCSDEDTYSSYLAQDFAQRGVRLGVVNAGVPSYNIRQSFDRFRADVLPVYNWERVAAVTLVAGNDVSLVSYYGTKYTPDLTWGRERRFISRRPEWQRLALTYYSASVRDRFGRADADAGAAGVPPGVRPDDAMLRAVSETLRRELAVFREHAVFVILPAVNPYFYQRTHQDRNPQLRILKENYGGRLPAQEQEWSRLIDRLNDTVEQVSREFDNARFLDTRKAFDEVDRDGLFTDYIHFTPRGSRLMATLIEDQLSASGRVKELR